MKNVSGDKHWVQRLPADVIPTFRSTLCESLQLGQVMASLVSTSDEVLGRLALYALVHVTPSYWFSHIDLRQLMLWYKSPHEGTSVAALACFSSILKYLVESNVCQNFSSQEIHTVLSILCFMILCVLF